MSKELSTKIAEGASAEIYTWQGERKILKLGKHNTSYEAMTKEYQNSLNAWENGLPVPQPFEFFSMDGRPGIVFERIQGRSLLDLILTPSLEGLSENGAEDIDIALITARVLANIHRKVKLDFPDQREQIVHSIHRGGQLSLAEADAVIDILKSLPVKSVLCHGDPNPGNILMCDNGPVIVDWMDASIGNPEADLAEFILMMRYAVLPETFPEDLAKVFNLERESIISEFMNEYTRLSGITFAEVEPWLLPVAARKLSADGVSAQEKRLLVQLIRGGM